MSLGYPRRPACDQQRSWSVLLHDGARPRRCQTLSIAFTPDGSSDGPAVGGAAPVQRRSAPLRTALHRVSTRRGANLLHVISTCVEVAGDRATSTCSPLNVLTRDGQEPAASPQAVLIDRSKRRTVGFPDPRRVLDHTYLTRVSWGLD